MIVNILDEERNRLAAARYRSFCRLPIPGDEQLFCHELLRHLENSVDEREREAAQVLRQILEHDATVKEVAELRGSTEVAVRVLLKKAREKLRQIALARPTIVAEDF